MNMSIVHYLTGGTTLLTTGHNIIWIKRGGGGKGKRDVEEAVMGKTGSVGKKEGHRDVRALSRRRMEPVTHE